MTLVMLKCFKNGENPIENRGERQRSWLKSPSQSVITEEMYQ